MSNQIADTPAHINAAAHTNGSNRDATPMARSTRELALLIEKQSAMVADLIRVVEMERAIRVGGVAGPTVSFPRASAEPQPRELIMQLLAKANDGRPGHLSTTALIAATGLGKSSVHHHVNELLDRGAVVVVKGKRLSSGKRGPDTVYHADAIAT